jgi:mono/diheme cytochrome c family protein
MLRKEWLALSAVPVLALAACGGGGGAARDPGAVAAAYAGPIGSTDVEGGRELYENVCNSCHAGGAPGLDDIAWTAAAMRQQIREGEGRMPAITSSRLSDEDMERVLAYMVTIGAVRSEAGGETAAPASDAAGEDGEDAATE